MTLIEIAENTGSDKKSSKHDYVSFYEKYFEPIRYDELVIVEIGIDTGESLKMWYEYFPNSKIFGIDIVDGHYILNISYKEQFSSFDRIDTFQCDQGDKDELLKIFQSIGPVDVLIEDGSHKQRHQQQNLAWLLPYVKPGKFFVIEDLYFSYCDEALESDFFIENPGDVLTLPMLQDFISFRKIQSNFMTDDEIKYIEEHTEFCSIEYGKEYWGAAECCVIKKKS